MGNIDKLESKYQVQIKSKDSKMHNCISIDIFMCSVLQPILIGLESKSSSLIGPGTGWDTKKFGIIVFSCKGASLMSVCNQVEIISCMKVPEGS